MKWEYSTMRARRADNGHDYVTYFHGEEVQNWSNPDKDQNLLRWFHGEEVESSGNVQICMNVLGEEGWELVSESVSSEKWEYMTRFVWANVKNLDDNGRSYVSKAYHSYKAVPEFVPGSMDPYMSQKGDDGWELVHMEPIPGVNERNLVDFNRGGWHWSNVYFAVFKRRFQETTFRFKRQKE